MIKLHPAPAEQRQASEVAAELLARSAAASAAPHAAAPPPAPGEADRPAAASTTPPARPAVSDAALRLLQFEAEIRRVTDEASLLVHLVNEMHSLVPYSLAMVWRRNGMRRRWSPAAVSSLPHVDPHTTVMDALARLLASMPALDKSKPIQLRADEVLAPLHRQQQQAMRELPISHALWVPLPDRLGNVDAGLLVLREAEFNSASRMLLRRLGETYAHAWNALGRRARRSKLALRSSWVAATAVAAAAGVLAMPVRLNVMAPVEVVAAQPQILTAPISGVVKRIEVAPGATVKAGDTLVVFDDIQPRNEMLLAQQRLAVSQARNARVTAAAFDSAEATHELATARAEYELARVNFDYAVEVLARTKLRAPRAGVVVYSDRRDLEGRAVQVGEQLLQVADPSQVAMRVDLPVRNAIAMEIGGAAEVFLDNAPLGGVPAQVRYVSYTPRTLPGGDASYTVMLDPADGAAARIGARGTARLYGAEVPLAVQLLRRPLSTVRQWVGW